MSVTKPTVRFYRGTELIASVNPTPKTPFALIAESAGVDIPTNCTSGNCGTCLVRLIKGEVEIPDPLPPGLDEYLVDQGGILSCCLTPNSDCDIDILPPL